jgi:endoglucanase
LKAALTPRGAVIAAAALAVAVAAIVLVGLWPHEADRLAASLGRGINLGNMLDAPREGEWGVRLDDGVMALAKQAGFDSVRLPVRWSNYAQAAAPYRIDEAFFRRVDFAIEDALHHDLRIVVDMHHYHQLDGDPPDPKDVRVDDAVVEERFLAMWKQIAERYSGVDPERLLFELYNEPHRGLTAQRWNELLRKALAVVRPANRARYVVIGPAGYNKVEELPTLSLPLLDRRIIVTAHLYEPYAFTHQGTPWVKRSADWIGTRCCSDEQRGQITRLLDAARRWQRWHLRPVWIGEFGSYERADYESRVRYTRFLRGEIEARGFTWAYWELASRFGIYDPAARAWRTELRDALLGGQT